MSIALRSSTTGDINAPGATSDIFAGGKPAGTASTDVLLVCLTSSAFGAVGSITAPTGWNAVTTQYNVFLNSVGLNMAIFWALGSVASGVFTLSGSPSFLGWVCVALTGVDNTNAIDAVGTANNSTSSQSLTANGLTILTANAWPCIFSSDANDGTLSSTGLSAVRNVGFQQPVAFLYTTAATTGATGTSLITDTASATGNVIIAIPFAIRASITSNSVLPTRTPIGESSVFTLNSSLGGWVAGSPGSPTFTLNTSTGATITSQTVVTNKVATVTLSVPNVIGPILIHDPTNNADYALSLVGCVL